MNKKKTFIIRGEATKILTERGPQNFKVTSNITKRKKVRRIHYVHIHDGDKVKEKSIG